MRSNNKIVRLYTEKHLENMRSMFSTLYTDELLSDVTLCCRNGTLKAHKVVLAAISPYFRKVFVETCRQNAVFIMHGVDFPQLKSLIELIYVGCIDLPSDEYRLVCDLADSLEVKGVLIDDVEADESEAASPCGRDTRFRGQKRVAVDYEQQESTKFIRTDDKDKEDKSSSKPSCSTVWAKKLRKFKCELCPSSFKRASHLTRHQLVHTGERPYACDQCDKAFSRHDKLKHHIKKAHDMPTIECNESISAEALYTIGHVRILTPEPPKDSPSSDDQPPPQKKGRGRPRKYPPVPKPLVKRPRGRPRKIVIDDQQSTAQENYDITNLPFGDLEYLTKPLPDCNSIEIEDHPVMIEPLVEIKCEPQEKNEPAKCSGSFLDGIGLLESNSVAKIGECTISVANNTT